MPLSYDVSSNTSTPVWPAAFDLGTILGGVALGRDVSGKFAMSLAGIAVLRPNGTWVTIDAEAATLIDVTPGVLPGLDPIVVRLPVPPRRLARGDLIVVSDTPFSPMFVLEPGSSRGIRGLDPLAGQIVTFVQPRNMFLNFIVRAVSLFDVVTRTKHRDEDESRTEGRFRREEAFPQEGRRPSRPSEQPERGVPDRGRPDSERRTGYETNSEQEDD